MEDRRGEDAGDDDSAQEYPQDKQDGGKDAWI